MRQLHSAPFSSSYRCRECFVNKDLLAKTSRSMQLCCSQPIRNELMAVKHNIHIVPREGFVKKNYVFGVFIMNIQYVFNRRTLLKKKQGDRGGALPNDGREGAEGGA